MSWNNNQGGQGFNQGNQGVNPYGAQGYNNSPYGNQGFNGGNQGFNNVPGLNSEN
jgi:hypothetical protein